MSHSSKYHYELYHDQYLKYYGHIFQAHRPADENELLEYLNKQINFQEGDIVLDAGCGVCGPAIFFATNNLINIEAVTNCEKQVEFAQTYIQKEKLEEKIHLKLADFHYLDQYYPLEYFDKIIFLESFGHASDKTRVIKSAYKVLKYNGFIYIKDYFATEIIGSHKRQSAMKKAVQRMNNHYAYELADLYLTLKTLRTVGLRVLKMQYPEFELSNKRVVEEFENNNSITLFDSEYKPNIVEPYEIFVIKKDDEKK